MKQAGELQNIAKQYITLAEKESYEICKSRSELATEEIHKISERTNWLQTEILKLKKEQDSLGVFSGKRKKEIKQTVASMENEIAVSQKKTEEIKEQTALFDEMKQHYGRKIKTNWNSNSVLTAEKLLPSVHQSKDRLIETTKLLFRSDVHRTIVREQLSLLYPRSAYGWLAVRWYCGCNWV